MITKAKSLRALANLRKVFVYASLAALPFHAPHAFGAEPFGVPGQVHHAIRYIGRPRAAANAQGLGQLVTDGRIDDHIPGSPKSAGPTVSNLSQHLASVIGEPNMATADVRRLSEQSIWELYKWHLIALVSFSVVEGILIARLLMSHHRHSKARREIERLPERQHLDDVVANVPGVVWETHTQPCITNRQVQFVSQYVEKMLGYSVDEWLSSPDFWLSIIPEEDREAAARESTAILLSRREGTQQFRWMAKDGRVLWVEAHMAPILDADGTSIGLRGATIDITDRKRAEEALKQSEGHLAGIIGSAMDAIISVDDSHRIILFNTAAERMFGLSAGDAIGQTLERLIPNGLRDAHQEYVREFGPDSEAETPVESRGASFGRRSNGEEFPIEASISHVQLKEQKFHTVIVRDITGRWRAQQAIRESEANYYSIFNAANDAIFVHDPETGQILDANRRMCEMYGYSVEEVRRLKVGDLSSNEPPYTQEGALNWIRKAVGGEPQLFEWRARDRTGRLFWVEVSLRCALIGSNRRLLAVVRDITDRKQAEEAVRQSEERFRNVADTAPVMIWMSGHDKLLTYFNKRWLDFTGRTIEQELGNGWTMGIRSEDRLRVLELRASAFAQRAPLKIEYRLRRWDGIWRWIYDSGTPRFSSAGEFQGYIGSCIDITDRKEAEEALRDLSGRLIRAQEEERRRIARELHDDLNQRLALLLIELDRLRQALFEKQDSLEASVHNLWTEAQEISLEIHRLSYDLHPSRLDHLGLVTTVKVFCEELSEWHGLKIDFRHSNIPAALPKDVALCMFRIVQESLRNVIKHSGAVEAQVSLTAADHAIHLDVADSGMGFSAESAEAKAGLGLLSMRERLRLVNGEISIHSKPSCGTRIEVRVPLADGTMSRAAFP